MRDRLRELSKSVEVVNSNLRDNLPENAEWIDSITRPYSVVHSPCERVRVALLGLLSDEPGVFRDNTFKGIPLGNVIDAYSLLHQELVPKYADFCLPMTHQSMNRDKELSEHMLEIEQGNGLIIGGHEHEPFDELIEQESRSIRVLKSGMEANGASLIDLSFEVADNEQPRLIQVDTDLVEMSRFEPSTVVQSIVDKHMSVVKALEEEYVVDTESTSMLPPGVFLSSERTRYQQTTVGGIFCQMIKEELEVDVAMINGATIKGGKSYETNEMSYAELKKELPFPTKIVTIPMQRWELEEVIHYSRTAIVDGTDSDAEEIPRRGYLQVDRDYVEMEVLGFPDDVLQVALPRNLLTGFCQIEPLMEIGSRLQAEGVFPGPDDYVPAIDLIVRHACKNKWAHIISDISLFQKFDLNGDGLLDRYEIKQMMEKVLGHEPADFLVDDMIASIDTDDNGVIDMGEFSFLLANMERDQSFKKF